MASQSDEMRGHATCAVDVSPDMVDAGAELTLKSKVSCSPAHDLRGHILLVKDQASADVGSVELTEYDGEANQTSDFVVKAPIEVGEHTWSVVCPAVVKEGISYDEASAKIAFTVKAHATSVIAWDIPSAIVVGARFRIRVGIKCSTACDLTNSGFAIYNHEGIQVAAGMLSGDWWPDTTGLYVTEVELEAPSAEGLYTWTVNSPGPPPQRAGERAPGAPGSSVGIPHAEGSVSFGVRVVRHPEYVVTVETVDKVNQTPLSGAHVVMHPYKAVTDERGIAELRVAGGTYKLFVSQNSYLTFGLPVEVTAHMTARAELDEEPVTERY
jgi:hypothetical protein